MMLAKGPRPWPIRLFAVLFLIAGACTLASQLQNPGATAAMLADYSPALANRDGAIVAASARFTITLIPVALIWLLASQWLEVSAAAMFWSIVQVVVLPIALGVLAQSLLRDRVKACVAVLPLVSVVAIVAIVAAVVAGSQQKIATSGLLIFAVVVLHNGQLVADGEPAEVIASPVVQQAYLGIVAEEAA